MKHITTKDGKRFAVSEIDYEYLTQFKWYSADGRYARNNNLGQMHRVILERMLGNKIPKLLEADHINRITQDNRRENLRLATKSENRVNSDKKIGLSGFRGVRQLKGRNKWRAEITTQGEKIFIGGSYNTPQDAAIAYNNRAKELYGEFAYLNLVS